MALDCAGCDGYDYNDQNWGKQIKCLKCEIQTLKNEIKGMSEGMRSFSTEVGKSNQIFGDMLKTINGMRVRMYEFTKSTSQQYQLAEEIAKSYKDAALNIGLAVNRSRGFSQAFKGGVAEVAKFGGTITDVQGIYQDFADSSGRVRILGEDEVSNIFKLGKATNLMGSEAAKLYENLELMGVSNVKATERLEQLIIDSQNIGLNSSKVMKTLSQNMSRMQTFSFSNGVKGMTQMAKLAVKMRMDVGDMLGMAEKFYEPEAAIEAAANLQMLGGDIAQAFGDPFETMYLARNKPEELAEKVGSMVENMMTFNEQTGEYEFPAEARMQLKAAGDQLGINVDKMIEMTRQSSKMKDVKDKLSMGGMFSDEEMEGIASIARMDGGEFKVDLYDESGKKIEKSLDQLNKDDLKMLMIPPKDEEDYMSKMLNNSMTTNEILKSIEDTFQKTFVKDIDVFQALEDGSKLTIAATRDMVKTSLTEGIKGAFKEGVVSEIGSIGKEQLKETDKAMADYINSLKDNFLVTKENADLDIDVNNGKINILGVTDVNLSQGSGGSGSGSGAVTSSNPLEAKEKWCKDNGHTGLDPSDPTKCADGYVHGLAKGGIVTKPINALIGEGGESEVVFPLSKLENFIQTQKMGGKVTLEGNPTITLNINSNGTNLSFAEEDKMKMKDSIISVVTKMFNNGGSPDGANIPQGSKGFIQTM